MRLLQYKNLNLRRMQPAFEKLRSAIEADDFRSADIKKLNAGPYYRAKLDHANRLLLQFARVQSAGGAGETVCLALEVIEIHAYERSRFLRGATVDEVRIEREPAPEATSAAVVSGAVSLRWLGAGRTVFELLDKPIVFDEAQEQALLHPAPLVVIGSAGSGKTAVTLARLREAEGRVRSPPTWRKAPGRSMPPTTSRTRSRRSTSSATASCWRPCAFRPAAR